MKTLRAVIVPSLILAAGIAFFVWAQGMKKNVSTLPVYGKVEDFSLTDQDGQAFSSSELRGKVWTGAFIFTRCAGICPLMTSKMKKVNETIGPRPDFQLVSFSVDPEHDTPEKLKAYTERQAAAYPNWHFLTGKKDDIFALSEQHFRLGVSMIPEEERPSYDQAVRHSSKLALVDREGQIRGYYDTQAETLEALIKDAASLLKT